MKDPAEEIFINMENNDPFGLFEGWFAEHSRCSTGDIHAVALSTAGPDLRVTSRIVLVKDFGRGGFLFYTNYGSRKGIQLSRNPFASLLYYWPELHRQVRIEGRVEKVSEAESDRYFYSRPFASRVSAIVSPQSSNISSLQEIRDLAASHMENPAIGSITRPSWWGGFRLVPDMFEFWLEGEHRLHYRLQFNKSDTGDWTGSRLAP